jgi:hypothetical protein
VTLPILSSYINECCFPDRAVTDVMIFKNIFAEKISEKLAFLTQNKAKLCKILIIAFWDQCQFFCRKLSKIAENCEHNIDPWPKRYSELQSQIFLNLTLLKLIRPLQRQKPISALHTKWDLLFNLNISILQSRFEAKTFHCDSLN